MNWTVIGDHFDYLLWGNFPDGPLGGMALTLLLSVYAGVAASLLGIAGGILLAMSRGGLNVLISTVIGFFRAIPVLMLIFWVYFLLPIVFGLDVPEIGTVVCALALIGGAYLAHGVQAGINAIPRGQWEAGQSSGLTRWQTLRLIVLPQALRMMLPSFVNQWISLIKDTSLAYIVGVSELTYVATQVNNQLMVYPLEIFLCVGLMYFVLCTALDLAAARLGRRSAV
ncbi:MAG: amino acid ABC transporter permease [Microvirgula sp.]